MEQWNGLMRKEWVQWRWQLVFAVGIMLIGLLALPTVVGMLTKDSKIAFEMTIMLSFMVMMVGMIIPVISFATMFNRDMKQQDLWLHSTASAYKLIGAKFLMAAVVGAVALLVPAVVVAIRFVLSDVKIVTFDELAFFGTTSLIFFFFISLTLMVIGFFFIIIDRLMKPFLMGFSIIVTGLLFVISVRLYGEITNSVFYENVFRAGKIDLLALKNSKLEIGEGSFLIMGVDLYIGDILFDIALTIVLFFIAIKLFAKKVRI